MMQFYFYYYFHLILFPFLLSLLPSFYCPLSLLFLIFSHCFLIFHSYYHYLYSFFPIFEVYSINPIFVHFSFFFNSLSLLPFLLFLYLPLFTPSLYHSLLPSFLTPMATELLFLPHFTGCFSPSCLYLFFSRSNLCVSFIYLLESFFVLL